MNYSKKPRNYEKEVKTLSWILIFSIIIFSTLFYYAGKQAIDTQCYNKAVKYLNQQINKKSNNNLYSQQILIDINLTEMIENERTKQTD